MNTERLLVLGNADLSPYITRDSFSVRYVPVYEENSEFYALDGNVFRRLLGYRVQINADIEDIPESAASALSGLLSSESFQGSFVFPDERTATFRMSSLSIEPMRAAGGVALFEASLSVISDVIPLYDPDGGGIIDPDDPDIPPDGL